VQLSFADALSPPQLAWVMATLKRRARGAVCRCACASHASAFATEQTQQHGARVWRRGLAGAGARAAA
jgi:hypothetical protein